MSRTLKKSIQLSPGNVISYNNNQYVITNILNLDSVQAKNIETSISTRIFVKDITPETIEINKKLANNLQLINGPDWDEANRRFLIIKPILEAGMGQRLKNIKIASETHKVSQASIYRWISLYEIEKRVSALVRPIRRDKGGFRISPKVEEIIQKHISNSYLSEQRLTPVHVHEKIKSDCRDLGLSIPHINTIRHRIMQISDEEKTLKRHGKDAARDKYKPSIGHFPGADYPLCVVQIDHTPMDIIVVDDEYRLPIGRPYLTLAIDVYSKVVHGYYIGLDPVGLCLQAFAYPMQYCRKKHGWPQWILQPHILCGGKCAPFIQIMRRSLEAQCLKGPVKNITSLQKKDLKEAQSMVGMLKGPSELLCIEFTPSRAQQDQTCKTRVTMTLKVMHA